MLVIIAEAAGHFAAMERVGLQYVPIVVSCYGRLHPDSEVALERIARQAARRLGVVDHRPLLRRARAGLAISIWRRAAARANACLQPLSRESLRLLFGDGSEEEGGGLED